MNIFEAAVAEQYNARLLQTIDGGVVVRCLTHGELIKVPALDIVEGKDVRTLVVEALAKCEGCQWVLPTTRWPEGAEL